MILRALAVFAVLLVVSSCTVINVTTQQAIDSIGKKVPVMDKDGKASLYQLDGAIYRALPVYYTNESATMVAAETMYFPFPDRSSHDIPESRKSKLNKTCLYAPIEEDELVAWNREFKTSFRYRKQKHTPCNYNEATFPKSKAKLLDSRVGFENVLYGVSNNEEQKYTQRGGINKVAHVVSYPFYVVDVGLNIVINPIYWILIDTPRNVYDLIKDATHEEDT